MLINYMKETEILNILYEWNPWKKNLEVGIYRPYYIEKLKKLSKTNQIITLTGPRRSGKSTILKQFMQTIENKESILYINFEESKFMTKDLNLVHKIYEIYRTNIFPKGKINLFLDEVQNVEGWEKFVRSIHEKGDTKNILITASVSDFISREYGNILTGRHIDLHVFPLNLKEFLEFKGILTGEKNETVFKREEIINATKEYLVWGGFPKIVLNNEKKYLLSTYFNDIINRDIIGKNKINEYTKLNQLAYYYLSNSANLHSFNKISKFLKLSNDTVSRFSYFFEESYLFFFIKLFAYSLKKQNVNPKKVYCIDNGLIESEGFKFMQDADKRLENSVFLHLIYSGFSPFYLKNGFEVDFYIDDIAIQVCYELNGSTEREIKALKQTNAKEKLIITWNQEENIEGIKVIPFWKWALDILNSSN